MKLYVQKNLNNIANDLLKVDDKRTDKVSVKEMTKILMFWMKLPESIKNDPEKVNKFISSFATEIKYRDFLEELWNFSYKSECPDVAGTITTYKHSEDPIPYENLPNQN